jgi:signal transduction histidine kinase
MKYIVFYFLILFKISLFAQDLQFDLTKIENSNDYQSNISQLENALKHPKIDAEKLLEIQVLLVNNYLSLSQFDKATALCQKEIIIAQRNNLTFNEASLYASLAKVFYFLNQKDKVNLYCIQCIKLSEKFQYLDLLKRCNHNLGVLALENSNFKLAEKYFKTAIEFGKKIPPTRKSNLGLNYRLLGSYYETQGNYSQSDSMLKVSTDIFRAFKDSAGLAGALTFYAHLFVTSKDYKKAMPLSLESVEIGRKLKNALILQTALSVYENILFGTNNYKESCIVQREIFQLEKTKSIENQKKEIANSEAAFKVAEIKNKQELQEVLDKHNKQNFIFKLLGLFFLTVTSIVFIFQKRNAKKEQEAKINNLKEILDAEEKERRRIAQDLHDNMGAHTTSILAQIDHLKTDESNKIPFQALKSDAENIMSMLRETIWILKTKTISIQNFYDIVKNYATKQLQNNLNIRVVFDENIGFEKQLSPNVTLNLYRIIQESIQNIVKHTNATEVQFNFEVNPLLKITITDNGNGFDIESKLSRSGIDNMQFRANEINYTLETTSQIGKGTQIVLIENV